MDIRELGEDRVALMEDGAQLYESCTELTAKYPGCGTGHHDAINYCIVAAAGEAGELANKWKKVLRQDKGTELTADQCRELIDEAGDVVWYIARLAKELDSSFGELLYSNLLKLAERSDKGTIKGEGDNR